MFIELTVTIASPKHSTHSRKVPLSPTMRESTATSTEPEMVNYRGRDPNEVPIQDYRHCSLARTTEYPTYLREKGRET